MSQDTDRIIARIKKCLELSKSPNANEASVALRQAKAMMDKYNISQSVIDNIQLHTETIVSSRKVPTAYEKYLHASIAKAFVCNVFVTRSAKATFSYVGRYSDVKVATYMFKVLYLALKQARADFRKSNASLSNLGKASNLFCEGWVLAIYQSALDLRESSSTKDSDSYIDTLTDEYLSKDVGAKAPRKRKRNNGRIVYDSDAEAYFQGFEEGEKQSLHLGIH